MVNEITTAFDLAGVPEQWRDFVQKSLLHWHSENFLARRSLAGKSGAVVMLIDIKTQQHNGQGILKLSDSETLDDERQRQEQIRSACPRLARWIPSITEYHSERSRSALLMTVAGHGLLETEVMASVSDLRLMLAGQKISESLLAEWNRPPAFTGGRVRADALLVEWLEHRIGPGGRVPEVLAKLLHVPQDCDTFRYRGSDYPNPFGFSRPTFPGSCVDLLPGRGTMHGDLHTENILISGPHVDEYYFIDFSFARLDSALFFDHAYLELHLLLVHRETATHERWHRICCALVGLTEPSGVRNFEVEQDDYGLIRAVAMIRGEIFTWIKRNFPDRREDLQKQILLARVAAGLNFANKRSLGDLPAQSDKKKIFSLLYAATAAKELFDYCRITVATDGPVALPENEISSPRGNAWREVWDACGGFSRRDGAYVLLAGQDVGRLPESATAQLGRLPWSLVIDFDRKGTASPFVFSAGNVLKSHRGLHQILPNQQVRLDFEAGTCWLFADQDPPAEQGAPLTSVMWRNRTLPTLRKVALELLKATTPKPIYIVVLAGTVDRKRLQHTVETLEEQIAGASQTIVVSRDKDDPNHVAAGSESGRTVICNWQDLALGIQAMLGDASDGEGIWIPVRDPDSKAVRREQIEPTEVALFAETIDIVPAGLTAYRQDSVDADRADFLRGNTITWRELDLHIDVDRDVVRGPQGILHLIKTLLATSPTDSFAIEHKPGAGATTVARRVAWELRDEYPCVILKSLTDSTLDILQVLFQRSNLPLLIVVEAARLPEPKRDSLFYMLKGRDIRFVILYVRRRHKPRATTAAAFVEDPMSLADARRFRDRYEPRTPQHRRQALRDLAEKPDMLPYRSPFFFGLYAFEQDFILVPKFVRDVLEQLPEKALHAVAQLALIRAYSQEALPEAALRVMLGLPESGRSRSGYAFLAERVPNILMFDGKNVSIAHPVLAHEILRQHLQPSGLTTTGAWRLHLPAFCLKFIEEMAAEGLRESGAISDILTDLFIERSARQDTAAQHQFSDLINNLGAEESQRRVLEALCKHFPCNAHFWNHLGRHISIRSSGTFSESEAKLLRAIELEPDNDVHRHALGMVYHKEIRQKLQDPLASGETAAQRLDIIRPIFSQAEDCFTVARELNRDSRYPVVSPIQMIIETFERLAKLAGAGLTYRAFLSEPNAVAEWCRGKIVAADELLSLLRHMEANAEPSSHLLRCESKMQGVLGNFDIMVQGLTELLRRPDVERMPVRRMLARGYLQQIELDGSKSQPNTLRRVVELMEANLIENPSNGHDVRTWFRAYRMLPDFTLVRALEQMTQWAMVSEDIDAKYYLYILHFLAARQGIARSRQEALKYIELCRRQAGVLQSKNSFEWWAAGELRRACPLVHHSELGPWSKKLDFFEVSGKLGAIKGRIEEVRSPQSGTIVTDGIPAFFVPRSQFYRARDLNATVTYYLGFSYEGLRAWNVRHAS